MVFLLLAFFIFFLSDLLKLASKIFQSKMSRIKLSLFLILDVKAKLVLKCTILNFDLIMVLILSSSLVLGNFPIQLHCWMKFGCSRALIPHLLDMGKGIAAS